MIVRPTESLAARNITSGYKGTPVIRDVSLSVGAGEVVLVVGPNGAGKSTLVKTINGELPLMSGSVVLDGEDISALAEERRASRGIGYVPQVRDVFPTLTVRENLEMGAYRLSPKHAEERVEAVMAQFPQLKQFGKRHAKALSGGQRKLVGVARAMVADPTMFILDEPTSNLSPGVAKQVLHDVVATLASSGKSLLLIEQRVVLALEVATWVYVMVDGQVRFSGSTEEFRSRKDMASLFFGGVVRGGSQEGSE
jgi:ABC-type branched-subunit amino acid transport system ATPase component